MSWNRGWTRNSQSLSPSLVKVNEDRGEYDERTEESKIGLHTDFEAMRSNMPKSKISNPFKIAAKQNLRESNITGTWQGAKADEIEDYLLGT